MIFVLGLVFYAMVFEYNEHSHSYDFGKPNEKDSIPRILQKIDTCAKHEIVAVRWRRILISALVITYSVFMLVHRRKPQSRELLLFMVIIFMVLFINSSSFVNRSCYPAYRYAQQNIENLKNKLVKNYTHIFPW